MPIGRENYARTNDCKGEQANMMSVKGTISATFNDIETHFKSLVIVSVFPAVLLLMIAIVLKLITLLLLNIYLHDIESAAWFAKVSFFTNLILQCLAFFVSALWFTVIASHMAKQTRPRITPTPFDMKNAMFVSLYGFLFSLLAFVVIYGFVQVFFFFAGVPFGTTGKVTIPWRQSGPMLVIMPLVLALVAWLSSVTNVNMPRIASGYRPNLFKEVIQYSQGVQIALTLRTVCLFFSIMFLLFIFSFFLFPPLMGLIIASSGTLNPTNQTEVIALQISMTKASLLLEPVFTVLVAFMIWVFSLFLIEASRRIEKPE
jgi:hypothetical protein